MFTRLSLPSHISATEKVFLKDQYQKTLEAKVLYVDEEFVVLDRSIFYAESGGQDFDIGYINDQKVVDVQDQGGVALTHGCKYQVPTIKIHTTIVHKLSQQCKFSEGDTVTLRIDWNRRYNLMRNHSASHFLYHACDLVVKKYNDELLFTSGCHISEQGARFDFINVIEPDMITEIEELANQYISQGLDIVLEKEPTTSDVFYWRYANENCRR